MGIGNSNETLTTGISRRTVTKGIAWATPAVAAAWAAPTVTAAAAAPAYASSLRKDPGINGWIMNWTSMSVAGVCGLRNYVNGRRNQNIVTPDGAPTGLYIYDIEDTAATFSGAAMTIWVPGTPIDFSYNAETGHSSSWVYQGSVGSVIKPDSREYTGYKFNYTGTFDMTEVEQGLTNARVWLEDFNVTYTATYQTTGGGRFCHRPGFNHRNVWVQREITVDRDGDADRYSPEYFCFQRPGSTRYPCDNGANRTASTQSTGSEVVYGEVL